MGQSEVGSVVICNSNGAIGHRRVMGAADTCHPLSTIGALISGTLITTYESASGASNVPISERTYAKFVFVARPNNGNIWKPNVQQIMTIVNELFLFCR